MSSFPTKDWDQWHSKPPTPEPPISLKPRHVIAGRLHFHKLVYNHSHAQVHNEPHDSLEVATRILFGDRRFLGGEICILLENFCHALKARSQNWTVNLQQKTHGNWQIDHFYSIFCQKLVISLPHCRCYTTNLPSNDQHVSCEDCWGCQAYCWRRDRAWRKAPKAFRMCLELAIEHPRATSVARDFLSSEVSLLLLILEHRCIYRKKRILMANEKLSSTSDQCDKVQT